MLAMELPVSLGDGIGIKDAVLGFERVALGEIVADEGGVDGAVDQRVRDMDALGRARRAMLCASARKPCLAPANAAKPSRPRMLAVAPVNRMVPWPRGTITFATSRPPGSPQSRPSPRP